MLINLIGPVRIAAGGSPTPIAAPKRACVLAVLAERPGRRVSKEDLIDHVWDGDPPQAVLSALYSYITRLRAALRTSPDADIARAGSGGYLLTAAPARIDVHALRDLAARAGALRTENRRDEALDLWRRAARLADGEALAGIGGRWAENFRTEFRRERRGVLAERFSLELAAGHHAAVCDELAAHVAADPFAEALAAHAMLALHRCGRPAEALKTFETTRLALRDALGSDPSTELRRLHRGILDDDPALAAPPTTAAAPAAGRACPVPSQLPADTPGFLGRDAELTAVAELAASTGVIVVDGMPGAGKSALAVRAARTLAPHYPDGRLHLDLRGHTEGVTPMRPAEALSRLLSSLRAEVPEDPAELPAAWRTALAGRRVLVVLDNARDAAQVRPLLPGAAGCLTVVTSRRRLVDLVDARPVSLGPLPAADAARLFAAEAGTDPADATTAAIAEACGRLPLALRIAASRLRNRPAWTPADLLGRLTARADLLRDGVFAAFDLSYAELDDTTRRVFRLLSLNPGPEIDHDTAAALTGLDPGHAETVLEDLLDVHMVLDGRDGGYRLHDLLRRYAARAVTDPAERDAALLGLAASGIAAADACLRLIAPETPALGLVDASGVPAPAPADLAGAEAWFQARVDALRRLVDDLLTAGHTAHAVELCSLLLTYYNLYSAPAERRRLAELGLTAARSLGSPAAEGRLTTQIGIVLRNLGAYDEAVERFHDAARLRVEAGDPRGEFVFLYDSGIVRDRQGRFAEAADLFLRAAAIARRQGDDRAEAQIRDRAAGALLRLGRLTAAGREIARLEELVPAEAARAGLELRLKHSAFAYMSGDHATAIAGMREHLAYTRHHGHPYALAANLSFLTDALLADGRHAEALDRALEQLDVLEPFDRPHEDATALRQIGAAQAGLGRTEDAEGNLLAAIDLADSVGAAWIGATARHALGDLHAARGDIAAARVHLGRALDYFAPDGYPEAARIQRRLAETAPRP